MMIAPYEYIESIKNKSYEELLELKKELNREIEEFENKTYKPELDFIDPSPDVVYSCNLKYMAELCNLICEKFEKE